MNTASNWLSVKQAAESLGLNETSVYRLCQAKKIPHRRIGAGGGRIVFTPEDLAAYLESCRVPIGEATPEPAAYPVRLEFFRPQGSRRA
jgi:excisionase family DNA binding protein